MSANHILALALDTRLLKIGILFSYFVIVHRRDAENAKEKI
jgi:hypothetical protein